MLTSRTSRMVTLLPKSSAIDGRTLTSTPRASARSVMSWKSSFSPLAIAIRTMSAAVVRTTSSRSASVPRTGIPWILRCRRHGSSSTNATGTKGEESVVRIEPTSCRAASPAPTMTARRAPSLSTYPDVAA